VVNDVDRIIELLQRLWEADQRFSQAIEHKVDEHLVGPVVDRVQQSVVDKALAWAQPRLSALLPSLWPLAYLAAAVGVCLVIVGLKRLGFKVVRWSIIGYFVLLILITMIGGGIGG